MNKPLHIQLLEELEVKGIGVCANIAVFMANNFEKPQSKDPNVWKSSVYYSRLFLNDLIYKSRVVIIHEENTDPLSKLEFSTEKNHGIWYDAEDLKIEAYITSDGLDYLDNYKSQSFLKGANMATIGLFIITLLMSFTTIFLTVKNYNISQESLQISKSNSKSDSLNSVNVSNRLDTLTKLIKPLKVELKIPRYQKILQQQKRP